ncbi:MAG: hypothetical protein PSX71_04815 [bacterium]|nr:hypothetical protein [bacterium]
MRLLAFFAALLLSTSALAEGFKSPEATKEFSDKLMIYFSQAKFTEGLNTAKPYWPLPVVEIDGLANQINQSWPIVDKRMGKSLGSEYIKSIPLGSSIIRHLYLQKLENHFIFWQIDFYKPNNEWRIDSIKFLDSLDPIFMQLKG